MTLIARMIAKEQRAAGRGDLITKSAECAEKGPEDLFRELGVLVDRVVQAAPPGGDGYRSPAESGRCWCVPGFFLVNPPDIGHLRFIKRRRNYPILAMPFPWTTRAGAASF